MAEDSKSMEQTKAHGHPPILGRFSYGDILFLLVSLVMLSYTFGFVTQLKQIPSPLYGGDYYNGLGGVIHILDGGSILNSAQMAGEIPWVPWLYHLSVAIFSRITGIEPMMALIDFSVIIEVLALAVIYLL